MLFLLLRIWIALSTIKNNNNNINNDKYIHDAYALNPEIFTDKIDINKEGMMWDDQNRYDFSLATSDKYNYDFVLASMQILTGLPSQTQLLMNPNAMIVNTGRTGITRQYAW